MIIRKFLPGSEWLYLKIYTGVRTADIILQEVMGHLINDLVEKNLIKKWFFIRYSDPKHHLRVRFLLSDNQNYNIVLERLNSCLGEFIVSGEITNVMLDSYVRELERYQENIIEDAEELFCKSSELVMNFIESDDEEKIMLSIFYIDQLLIKIKSRSDEKMMWISNFDKEFKKEFNSNKNLNGQLNNKFKIFSPKYQNFVGSDEFRVAKNKIFENIGESSSPLENILKYNKHTQSVFLASFFQSIFHMHINRMFNSNQRLFEMIIYDFLQRHYQIEAFAHITPIESVNSEQI